MSNQYKVTVNGKIFDVSVEEIEKSTTVQEVQAPVVQDTLEVQNVQQEKQEVVTQPEGEVIQITSPMPGNIWKVLKQPNERVNKHEAILILEVMKMENEIVAPESGVITNILVSEGNKVEASQLIVEMRIN